jgi:hypothetical protein
MMNLTTLAHVEERRMGLTLVLDVQNDESQMMNLILVPDIEEC